MCSCFMCLQSVKALVAGLPLNSKPYALLLSSVAPVSHWIIPKIDPVVSVTDVSLHHE